MLRVRKLRLTLSVVKTPIEFHWFKKFVQTSDVGYAKLSAASSVYIQLVI
jgi:hypothetical protein